jgi:hypothetical protein
MNPTQARQEEKSSAKESIVPKATPDAPKLDQRRGFTTHESLIADALVSALNPKPSREKDIAAGYLETINKEKITSIISAIMAEQTEQTPLDQRICAKALLCVLRKQENTFAKMVLESAGAGNVSATFRELAQAKIAKPGDISSYLKLFVAAFGAAVAKSREEAPVKPKPAQTMEEVPHHFSENEQRAEVARQKIKELLEETADKVPDHRGPNVRYLIRKLMEHSLSVSRREQFKRLHPQLIIEEVVYGRLKRFLDSVKPSKATLKTLEVCSTYFGEPDSTRYTRIIDLQVLQDTPNLIDKSEGEKLLIALIELNVDDQKRRDIFIEIGRDSFNCNRVLDRLEKLRKYKGDEHTTSLISRMEAGMFVLDFDEFKAGIKDPSGEPEQTIREQEKKVIDPPEHEKPKLSTEEQQEDESPEKRVAISPAESELEETARTILGSLATPTILESVCSDPHAARTLDEVRKGVGEDQIESTALSELVTGMELRSNTEEVVEKVEAAQLIACAKKHGIDEQRAQKIAEMIPDSGVSTIKVIRRLTELSYENVLGPDLAEVVGENDFLLEEKSVYLTERKRLISEREERIKKIAEKINFLFDGGNGITRITRRQSTALSLKKLDEIESILGSNLRHGILEKQRTSILLFDSDRIRTMVKKKIQRKDKKSTATDNTSDISDLLGMDLAVKIMSRNPELLNSEGDKFDSLFLREIYIEAGIDPDSMAQRAKETRISSKGSLGRINDLVEMFGRQKVIGILGEVNNILVATDTEYSDTVDLMLDIKFLMEEIYNLRVSHELLEKIEEGITDFRAARENLKEIRSVIGKRDIGAFLIAYPDSLSVDRDELVVFLFEETDKRKSMTKARKMKKKQAKKKAAIKSREPEKDKVDELAVQWIAALKKWKFSKTSIRKMFAKMMAKQIYTVPKTESEMIELILRRSRIAPKQLVDEARDRKRRHETILMNITQEGAFELPHRERLEEVEATSQQIISAICKGMDFTGKEEIEMAISEPKLLQKLHKAGLNGRIIPKLKALGLIAIYMRGSTRFVGTLSQSNKSPAKDIFSAIRARYELEEINVGRCIY